MIEYLKPDTILNNLANLPQIVFEVTDACNLKCKYCAYGEFYGDYDNRCNQMLSIEKAKNVLLYLNQLWNSERNRSSNRIVFISFYGGEPLLNFAFIKEIVSFVKQKLSWKHRTFMFSMTTNALLLHKHIDFLVENEFHLLVSLDGNKTNNSYRVNHNGENSFDQVVLNVDLLRNKYPDYFDRFVNFNSVFHNRSTVDEVYAFFKEKYNKTTNLSEINNFGIRPEKTEEFNRTYKNVSQNLHQSEHYEKIESDMAMKTSDYKEFALYLHRHSGNFFNDYTDLMFNQSSRKIYPTGTCLPFQKKMFITVTGKILPCERIGHQYGLGTITDNGVDLDLVNIAEKYNNYLNKMTKQCSTCYRKKSCIQCMFNLENLDQTPKCNGHWTCLDYRKYEAKQMQFLYNHPMANRYIMEKVISL